MATKIVIGLIALAAVAYYLRSRSRSASSDGISSSPRSDRSNKNL